MPTSLTAAAQDRKARLAQLKSVKNKQPSRTQTDAIVGSNDSVAKGTKRKSTHANDDQDIDDNDGEQHAEEQDAATTYLSGRNYDTTTKGPKLGFEAAPDQSAQSTLEKRAAELAETVKAESQKQQAQDQPLDLFKLQPKKPNWDLKRDLDEKLKVLNVQTSNAIARLVRERIASAKEEQRAKALQSQHGPSDTANVGEKEASTEVDDDAIIGMDGNTLVEATKELEREAAEEARQERELDAIEAS